MKARKKTLTPLLALLVAGLAGCGPSKDELAARERARIEAERKAQEDAAKANKAITDMNQKMFSRMNASRTGAPQQPANPPVPTPPPAKTESPKP